MFSTYTIVELNFTNCCPVLLHWNHDLKKKIPLKSTLPEDDSTTVSAIMANLFLIFKKIFLYILMIIWTNLYKPYMSLRTVTAFLANWCFSKRRFEKFFFLFVPMKKKWITYMYNCCPTLRDHGLNRLKSLQR